MDVLKKLEILTESAKYDASCSSSGSTRTSDTGSVGAGFKGGICHAFAADGRCISLLKVLLTNACIYDCSYCVNRKTNDFPRTAFSPRELADLTISFYRRNYIEGLFLSSAIKKSPDYTMEQMYECLRILREEYHFGGYIHAKIIPGANEDLIALVGSLADRVSVNLELPSEKSLTLLAPDKTKSHILTSMKNVSKGIITNKQEIAVYKKTPTFAPAGQSTQMIIGASPETDLQIIRLTEGLYNKYKLKRVYYSAYMPMGDSDLLPQKEQPVPLLREHRLYQADWLLRFYGFQADEILDEKFPFLDPFLDPKCNWAINHFEEFPVEINTATYAQILRVPGIGVTSAQKIVSARKHGKLTFSDLKKMRIVLKRAIYFITCNGKYMDGIKLGKEFAYSNLVLDTKLNQQGLPTMQKSVQPPLSFLQEQQESIFSRQNQKLQEIERATETQSLATQSAQVIKAQKLIQQGGDYSGFLG